MIGIQLVAVVVGLLAIYLSTLYNKKKVFGRGEMAFWVITWLALIGVALFPHVVEPLRQGLGLERSMDFIMIVAFIVLFLITFYSYTINSRVERRLEELVRRLALKDLDNK